MTFSAPKPTTAGSDLRERGLKPSFRRSSVTETRPPGHGAGVSSPSLMMKSVSFTSYIHFGFAIGKYLDLATIIFVNIFVRGFSDIDDVKMVRFS